MARLWDFRLGAGVNVADERVGELIDSGDYAFIAGQEIVVQDLQIQTDQIPHLPLHLAFPSVPDSEVLPSSFADSACGHFHFEENAFFADSDC